jgi:hypothetical protein
MGGYPLNEGEHFVEMLAELAPLLADLPRGSSQDIVCLLSNIARLQHDLERARGELERKLALSEAGQIVGKR